MMGRYGSGIINENGENLFGFCTTDNLVIGWTLFPHREIYKITWCSPNGRDRNQIDHLMINRKWRSFLQDVKVRRGAHIGSDQHLVTPLPKIEIKGCRASNLGGQPFRCNSTETSGCAKNLSLRCGTDSRLLWN